MDMTTFVTFGETMAQYNATYVGPFDENGEYMLDCAGAESNVAADLQKLGLPNIATVWISSLGDDRAGDFILDQLKGRTEVVVNIRGGENTGVSYLNHYVDGQHVKTYRRKGSAASMMTFEDVAPHLPDANVVHVTGITPALSDTCRDAMFAALDYARKHDIPVSFDLNWREQLWDVSDARDVFERMVGYSTLFKIGHDEAKAVWGKGLDADGYARHFQAMNGGIVIVTRGDEGAVVFDGVNRVEHAGFKVEVVDPVGAGDAFVAGFLGGVLEHHTLKEFVKLPDSSRRDVLQRSLEIANACGALTCTRRGDTAAMPTIDEVVRFIASQGANVASL